MCVEVMYDMHVEVRSQLYIELLPYFSIYVAFWDQICIASLARQVFYLTGNNCTSSDCNTLKMAYTRDLGMAGHICNSTTCHFEIS